MTNKVYQVPYGTKDILPGEMKTRRGIENAIINVFDKWGYDEVKTPDFEYVDTFGAAGAKGDFRFFDRSNNLLALRNDMTAPIARLTATRLQGGEKIKRLCYLANLYRYEEIQAGRQCEFEQAGVEMLGASGAAAGTKRARSRRRRADRGGGRRTDPHGAPGRDACRHRRRGRRRGGRDDRL